MKELAILKDDLSTIEGSAKRVVDLYISTLKSDSTKKQYMKSITDFLNFIYIDRDFSILVSNDLILDTTHAALYQSYLIKCLNNGDFKRSTYNAKIKGIKKFYTWLICNTTSNTQSFKAFLINPFENIQLLSETDSDGSEPLTLSDIKVMLNNPYGSNEHIQERNILMLEMGIETGIRVSALMSATINDIISKDNMYVIKVKDKNDKIAYRNITRLYDKLVNWYHKDLYVRPKRENTIFGIVPDTANRELKKWCKSLSINKKITFHSLRTTTAKLVYNNTDSIGRTQMALNHSNTSTTKVYLDKDKKINSDTGNLLEGINEKSELTLLLENLTKEEIINFIKTLPESVRSEILKSYKN